MRRLVLILLVGLLALPLAESGAQSLVREYHDGSVRSDDLEVDVWVDNEDGIYYQGEDIGIYFQVNRDCYVAIYSVDTRGDVSLLFPEQRWEDGFVIAGEVYSIPERNADYDLVVSGPEGIEHIQAVASLQRLDIPDWYDGGTIRVGEFEDTEDFIEDVNYRYFSCRIADCFRAFDHTSIYVKAPNYYYQPVYVPDYWYTTPHYSMVYIDYPYGGEVYIDGIYFGIAPLWIPRVMIGWRWFTIYDRYGYCWESHINVYHNNTIYLDRTRVKTSRSVSSRYKEVRAQAKKYRTSDYVLSEQRVKSTRTTGPATSYEKSKQTDPRSKYTRPSSKSRTSEQSSTQKKSSSRYERTTRKTDNRWDNWSNKRSTSRSSESSKATKRSTSRSSGSSKATKSSTGRSSESSKATKSTTGSTRKSSGTSKGYNSSGSKKSSDGAVKSTPSKSSGGKSTGSTPKSSGGSTKSSGGKKSSGGRGAGKR